MTAIIKFPIGKYIYIYTHTYIYICIYVCFTSRYVWCETGRCFIASTLYLALEYATGRVRVNLEGVELNDKHMLLVSANDVSLLADSVYVIKREKAKF